MTLFQLCMTSAEGLLSLSMQGPLSLFIAACLEKLVGPTAFCDIQFKSGEPYHLPFGVAIGMGQTLDPRYAPIGAHNAERVVPVLPRLPPQNLGEEALHRTAVLLVNTGKP